MSPKSKRYFTLSKFTLHPLSLYGFLHPLHTYIKFDPVPNPTIIQSSMTRYRDFLSSACATVATSLLLLFGSFASGQDEASEEADSDQFHIQTLQAIGWMIASQSPLIFDFTKEEKEQIIIGIQRAANGHPAPRNEKALAPRVDKLLSEKSKEFEKVQEQRAKELAKTYLEEAVKTEGIEKTESGLVYQIMEEGIGKIPAPDDIVRVNYQGRLINGQIFDSSAQQGGPVDLPLADVIPGFREGIRLIREAGKVVLFVSPELGYGESGSRNVPPHSLLIFEVELIEVNPVGARVPGATQ